MKRTSATFQEFPQNIIFYKKERAKWTYSPKYSNNKCKLEFPNLPVDLSFETPNYKVHAGFYKDKLIGLKTLDTVRKVFPDAFLLKKTN